MTKLLAGLLFAFLVSMGVGYSIAQAFTPWNQRLYPGGSYNTPMIAKVTATSTMTWEVTDSFGWNGWADVVGRAIDTSSSYENSLGRIYNRYLQGENRGQIVIRRANAGESPDIINHAVTTAFLEAKCGDWATACVYLFNPLPVPAYYKAAAMITWPFESQSAVVQHEDNHALARSCDQYRGGCPLASTGQYESQVICTGNPDTLMDCGGAARYAQRFDYDTFVLAYPPTAPFLQVQVPPPPCVPTAGSPCWVDGRWRFADGWSFEPSSNVWYRPDGAATWINCNAGGNGACWSLIKNEWVYAGSLVWFDGSHYRPPVN